MSSAEREAVSPVAIELRRGFGKWLAVLVVAAAVLASASRLSTQTQDWPSAVVLLSNLGLVMGPLAIGVSAYAGGRAKRGRTRWLEWSSPRGPLRAGIDECAALLLWTAVGFLVVALVCFVPTLIQATWSGPDPARVAAAAGGVLAQTAVGYFVGRLIPYVLTAPFLAALSFSLVAVVNSGRHGQRLALYLPVNLNDFDFYNRTRPAASLLELGFYASCVAFAAAVWVLWTYRTLAAAATFVAGVVLVAASSAGLTGFDGQSNAPGVAIAFSCQGHHPMLCLHPATKDAASALRKRFASVVTLLDGTPFAIGRAEQRPRGVGSAPTAGAVGFGLDNRSDSSLDEARQELAHNAVSERAACADREGRPLPSATPDGPILVAAIGDRIADGRDTRPAAYSTDRSLDSAITSITSMTDVTFRHWLMNHREQIVSCSLTPRTSASS